MMQPRQILGNKMVTAESLLLKEFIWLAILYFLSFSLIDTHTSKLITNLSFKLLLLGIGNVISNKQKQRERESNKVLKMY